MTAKLDGTNGLLQQYDYQVSTTGFSYTFAAGTTVLVINPAGTLATGTITMPAAPADGMTISFSSTQTITALTVAGNTGQTIVRAPKLFGAGSAATYVYRLANTTWYPMTNYATAGSVLQVVTGTLTTQTSSTSTTDVTIGLSAAITPSSSTSKILVMYNLQGSTTNSFNATIYRGASAICTGTSGGSLRNPTSSLIVGSAGTGFMTTQSQMFLDSPATTSATTYDIKCNTDTGTFYVNRRALGTDFGTTSTVTLMEIAA